MSDKSMKVPDPVPPGLPPERVEWWNERCTHYPERRAVLLPLLHDLQEHLGKLTRDAMVWAADFVGITPVEVYGVATFYWMYDLEERAKFRVAVCHNISCDLRGKDKILEVLEEKTGIKGGHHIKTEGDWSVRTVECMGACSTAPMMEINGRYYEDLTPEKARKVLDDLAAGKEPESTTPWDTEIRPTTPETLPAMPGDRLALSYESEQEADRT